jgi:hypothetical protein
MEEYMDKKKKGDLSQELAAFSVATRKIEALLEEMGGVITGRVSYESNPFLLNFEVTLTFNPDLLYEYAAQERLRSQDSA